MGHLFDSAFFKFVGPTVSIEARNEEIKEPFIELFNKFPEIENRLNNTNPKKLIYFSCGTVFNNNPAIFRKIIDAFASFSEYLFRLRFNNAAQGAKLMYDDLTFVISTSFSKVVKDALANWKQEPNFVLPENIILVDFAPQLALLKRANLFMTHCGMNSSTEAVHFGGNFYLINYTQVTKM